jgi:DNA-binding MarR family transcriptional regulator
MTELTIRTGLSSAAIFRPEPDESQTAVAPLAAVRSRHETLMCVRHILSARKARNEFLNSKLFSDPAWDILLELYAAALIQRKLTVSRIIERSGAPSTTALRYLQVLGTEGLVNRQPDPLDGRQVYIILSSHGLAAMEAYFENLPAF